MCKVHMRRCSDYIVQEQRQPKGVELELICKLYDLCCSHCLYYVIQYIAVPHISLTKHSISITCGSHLISSENFAMLMEMAADRYVFILSLKYFPPKSIVIYNGAFDPRRRNCQANRSHYVLRLLIHALRVHA